MHLQKKIKMVQLDINAHIIKSMYNKLCVSQVKYVHGAFNLKC